ncbi:hypothetical protein QAD02_002020 [Eretmocerus hayati]|uniref:Uncharacterized protein n=1 Tax=Eretmocerus hayati TaxID=131215 RepID=A0ACC2NI44_9HYME|nr:hypothetical protein QAD02_002020 [Eretmocerus hayati]
MARLLSYAWILSWGAFSMICGLFLFTNGFFLRKNVIDQESSCIQSQTDSVNFKEPIAAAAECLKPSARVILLIVDALKYEFADEFDDAIAAPTFHRNKLTVIKDALKNHPENARLFKFIADPPTTTMQRLKGITTGTLPTFIDISNNFAADYIVEDNFIALNQENGNIFMGDDTWIKLYPQKFMRKYGAPSFDVSDLDTVDNEVRAKIFDEMSKQDWSLLIAHILGVDHCGHKHGMHHPEMLRKLNETNNLIQGIISQIDKSTQDTILFVVGDHGMTESGDHGGDSLDEIEAAMFVYSTLPLMNMNSFTQIEEKSIVNQIDIVPTISTILGIPIPFSNLGQLIIEAVPLRELSENSKMNNIRFITHSLWRNIYQVHHFVKTYLSQNSISSEQEVKDLKNMFSELSEKVKLLKNDVDFEHFVMMAEEFFLTVRKIFYKEWVQFEPILMSRGLIIFFCSMFSFFIVVTGLIGNRMCSILESSFLTFVVSATSIVFVAIFILDQLELIDDFENISLFMCGLVPILCFGILLIQNWDHVSETWYEESRRKKTIMNFFSRIVLVTVAFGAFSNSYIIEENKILSFFLVTLICSLVYSLKSKNSAENSDKKKLNSEKFVGRVFSLLIVPVIVLIVCSFIRTSNFFWRQREEQKAKNMNEETFMSFVIGKTGSVVSNDIEIIFVLTAIALIATYISVVKMWLRNCGNLSGYSVSELIPRFFPGLIVVCISCYWILKLQKNSKFSSIFSQRINSLPIIIYSLIVNGIILIFYRPLTVFILPKEKESISIHKEESSVPKIFEKMKNVLYKKKNEDVNEMPIVFGLGTVYSACFILLSVFLCLVYILLLGFVITPSVILMNLVCLGLLYFSALDRINTASSMERLLHVPNLPILCWFLIAEYFFYATGHQATFSTIHWDAGFVGVDGSYNVNFLRAILIGMNTFGSHIVLGVTLPLLVIAPFTLMLVYPTLTKSMKIQWNDFKRGELLLFQNDTTFHLEVFSVAGRYILFHAFRVFICMLATLVHCRHLMVWAIFAPKLIFEGISFIVSVTSVLVSIFLLLRIEKRIDKLIAQIT